jgi:hypothetical protein
MSPRPSVNVGPLRDAVQGDVVVAADAGWDEARRAWNLMADQSPELVVIANDVKDIAATVRFGAANGLRVAVQSTGHGATSLGELSGAILLRTPRLDAVSVDPEARIAQVQAGTKWRDVISSAGEHGLVCLHGMSGGVGVAGYTLGGGIGWLARREGFASSHVRSFQVVTADGDELHVDAEHEPDLFWALRGGGGSPVVVTALELELFPLHEAFAGAVCWPLEHGGEIAHAYHQWIASVPDTVTSTLKLMRFPSVPQVPEPFRGQALAVITLAFTGSEADGNELVAPLRAVAAPYLDTLATLPAPALGNISGDPQDPTPGVGRAVLLDELTGAAVDTYLELAGPGVQSPLTSLELRHLGGALRSTSPDWSAAGPLDSDALVYGVGAAVTPEVGVALGAALDDVSRRFAPWTGERRTLLTFDERGPGLRGTLPPTAVDRLASITAKYDPGGVLLANHVVA